jgi:excisionase family DNA binding protein
VTNGPTVEKLLYTPVEAAHALGVSRSTIYVLIAGGNLPSLRIGASRRIPAEGLRRYIAQLAIGTTASSPGARRSTSRVGPVSSDTALPKK